MHEGSNDEHLLPHESYLGIVRWGSRGFVLCDLLRHDGTDHPRKCPHTVADPHQDGGVSGGDVEVVDVEARDGKARTSDGNDERNDGLGLGVRIGDDKKKQSLSAEASTVEEFPHRRRRHDLVLPQIVGKLTAKWHDGGHDEVGQGGKCRTLSHVHVEALFEVLWLSDEEQVEGPATSKVGNNDGIDRHAGEHPPPWGREYGRGFGLGIAQ